MPHFRWIEFDAPGRITTMSRPRGGDWLDDDIRRLRAEGVDVIVSLLESDEAARLDLADESDRCAAASIDFVSHPIVDHGLPHDTASLERAARTILEQVRAGRSVAIHCFAGIGRATIFASAVLIHAGLDATDALDRIAAARGIDVPDTNEQLKWIIDYWNRVSRSS